MLLDASAPDDSQIKAEKHFEFDDGDDVISTAVIAGGHGTHCFRASSDWRMCGLNFKNFELNLPAYVPRYYMKSRKWLIISRPTPPVNVRLMRSA